MPTKQDLQIQLKDRYGINKNISQPLSPEECDQLLSNLENQPSVLRLVKSFTDKNQLLGNSNRHFGQLRSHAEKKLHAVKADYEKLEQQITDIEKAKQNLTQRKQEMEAEIQKTEEEIKELFEKNTALKLKVQTSTTRNDELEAANEVLKKDNKDLKNIVDQIRLRLARDTKQLLEYEDSEIRKALIRLFRWTLG
ncbi:hypothetical protein HRE53_27435 (plasmid) [Acaryochloris sp. 'Moss Beach']|uniref:hypothetical protein n=1 Tax=Acaryochloris sp. 'Moss Beach' TaxID=2740837 RepID=UPI001F439268|nr:hypothetical protein [Acaryochloris sp. 'Moss Beach']UJB72327.1 hypothetical protein HRE53_27435 [Acaryochloris sp. 'Moss Beach']